MCTLSGSKPACPSTIGLCFADSRKSSGLSQDVGLDRKAADLGEEWVAPRDPAAYCLG